MWIRKETHCRKNGGVTMKPRLVGWKKAPPLAAGQSRNAQGAYPSASMS